MKANPMLHFGEVNYPVPRHMPPYEQPREYVNAWLLDGELRVEVDCYSATDDSGEDFDVDRWEAEKFVMTAVPGRDVWRHMYRAARAFMHGYRIDFGDGRPVGLADHLAAVRAA